MANSENNSGISIKGYYTPSDIPKGHLDDIGEPGTYPFARGISAKRPGGWIQRELSGEGEAQRSNEQLLYLIGKGQTGIDVIGDSPTMGMVDPDHPIAANAVGTQGVSLCRYQDYIELFENIPLDKISVSSSVPPLFAMTGLYLAAKATGVPTKKLRGSVLQPPFYAEDCGYANHLPINLRIRLSLDCMEFASREMPRFHAYIEDTYFFSESGLNAVEEMALGLVEIRYLMRKMMERGIDVDQFAPRIAILVNCGMDFFEEVAKIRSVRRIFAQMMKEEFGAKDPRSMAVVIASHTSGLSLTAQQPFGNIVRGTIQALALVMAGVQALEISAFDEAFRTPSNASHLIGLRTQQIIHLESKVADVADPLGGSYYVESLTDDIEGRIRDMVRELESMGDAAELTERGYFKKLFHKAMERYAGKIGSGETQKVGLNVHRIPDEEDTILRDLAEEKIEPCWKRIDEIKEFRKRRDQEKVKEALSKVVKTARRPNENLVPVVADALIAEATMGEITGMMRLGYDMDYDPFGLIEQPF